MSSNFDLSLAIDQACDRAQQFLDELRKNKPRDGDMRMGDVRLLDAILRQIPIPPLPDRPSGAMPLRGLGLGIIQSEDSQLPDRPSEATPHLSPDLSIVQSGTALETEPLRENLGDSASVLQALKPLLKFIYSGEGGYDSYNQGRAGDSPGGWPGGLRKLTIAQIMQLQAQNQVFAVGAAQFIPTTLKIAVRESGLTASALFSAENQDRLAITLLLGSKRPKLAAYLKGENNDLDTAQIELAKEWASVPTPSGRGYYDGFAGNRANQKVAEVRKALRHARNALLEIINKGVNVETLNRSNTADGVDEDTRSIYIVKPGDTFSRIATIHGIPVDELKGFNPNVADINVIFPGQTIIVSASSGRGTGDDGTIEFDFKIAEKYISAATDTHHPFSNLILGTGKITGGFMELSSAHSNKGELKAIYLDNSLKTLPAGYRNIGIDYIIHDFQVRAWYGGMVTKRGLEKGYGNRVHILLDIEFNFEGVSYAVYQAYAHLRSISVSRGEKINQGQTIGVMGGSSTSRGRPLILIQGAYDLHVDLDTYIRKNGNRISINPQLIDKQLGLAV